MKKLWIIFFVLFIPCNCVLADDWDDMLMFDSAAAAQPKVVTEDEFEKTIQMFEKKPTRKELRNNKKMGTAIVPNAQEQGKIEVIKGLYETYPTIMVPVNLVTREMQEIPVGYYRIMSVKKPNEHYINFYQGNSLIARVRANATDDDYDQKTLNYAKILPFSDSCVKFIYGDLDCNLEAVINILADDN